jgi:D-serine deaminase-like pyridoxal phosphate-dependent protein
MGYEGRVRRSAPDRPQKIASAYDRLAEVKAALEAVGHTMAVVSTGGTSTLPEALAHPTVTEIQAGTYALMEPDIEDLGLPFQSAVYVVGTIISRSEGRIVLDVGRRSIGSDYGLPLCLNPSGTVTALNDEHTLLSWEGSLPGLGERVCLRPTQIRTTFNLHDVVWVASSDQIVDVWPVTARGKS